MSNITLFSHLTDRGSFFCESDFMSSSFVGICMKKCLVQVFIRVATGFYSSVGFRRFPYFVKVFL